MGEGSAQPLPINNRVVLHLLEALQILQVKVPGGGPAEARRLSFRALDIEQIGTVYQGLLDHTAVRAGEPVLGLIGTKDREPEVPLSALEADRAKNGRALLESLIEQTGRSEAALKRALDQSTKNHQPQLQSACGNDTALYARLAPFAQLIRLDDFEQPMVILPGSVYVTAGTERRSTGTHYTPRSLTEPIVQRTLEPLVYVGPAEGVPRDQWQLRRPAEILALKICDMAMGSASFNVQADRYLAELLVEAWEALTPALTPNPSP
jgi:type I restriction-modification system DNA methylase subunit